MATIAELQTKLTVDNAAFKRGMSDSTNAVKGFSNQAKLGMVAVAALVAGAVVTAFHALSQTLSEAQEKASLLVDTSTRLGAGIPELQRLQYAAQQSGIGIDSINSAMGKLLRNSAAAAQGTGPAVAAFKRLGINAQEFAKLKVDQQYTKISEAIKGITSPAEQALIAMQIFGKAGIQQLSLLKDNVGALINEYKGLGTELTENQAKSLEAYGDSVSKLDTVWEGFKNQLAAALAGPLKHILDWIVSSSIEMGGLGNAAQAVAAAILGASSTLVGFFGAIYRGIQYNIIAADELLILLLRIAQVSTLGLANPLGGAGDKIAALKQDVIQKSANVINSQNLQQKVQVEIKAAEGFVATVVNSNENTAKINSTVNSTIATAASGQQ